MTGTTTSAAAAPPGGPPQRGPFCEKRYKRAGDLADLDVVRLSDTMCSRMRAPALSTGRMLASGIPGTWREVVDVLRGESDMAALCGTQRDCWPEAWRALADWAFSRVSPDYVLVRLLLHEAGGGQETEDALLALYRYDLVETQELPAYGPHCQDSGRQALDEVAALLRERGEDLIGESWDRVRVLVAASGRDVTGARAEMSRGEQVRRTAIAGAAGSSLCAAPRCGQPIHRVAAGWAHDGTGEAACHTGDGTVAVPVPEEGADPAGDQHRREAHGPLLTRADLEYAAYSHQRECAGGAR